MISHGRSMEVQKTLAGVSDISKDNLEYKASLTSRNVAIIILKIENYHLQMTFQNVSGFDFIFPSKRFLSPIILNFYKICRSIHSKQAFGKSHGQYKKRRFKWNTSSLIMRFNCPKICFKCTQTVWLQSSPPLPSRARYRRKGRFFADFRSVLQTKIMFILVPHPRHSRPKRREASLSLSKLIIQIVSPPR